MRRQRFYCRVCDWEREQSATIQKHKKTFIPRYLSSCDLIQTETLALLLLSFSTKRRTSGRGSRRRCSVCPLTAQHRQPLLLAVPLLWNFLMRWWRWRGPWSRSKSKRLLREVNKSNCVRIVHVLKHFASLPSQKNQRGELLCYTRHPAKLMDSMRHSLATGQESSSRC